MWVWSLYKRHDNIHNKTEPKLKLQKYTQWIWNILVRNNNPIKDKILIGVIYRHPKQKDKEFLPYLSSTLKKIKKENEKIILTGDFNLNLLKIDKNKVITEFLDFLIAKCLTPQILGLTRITENEPASLIDNFFIDFNDLRCTSKNFLEKIRDHLLNFLIIEKLNYHLKKKERPYKIEYTNFEERKI